MHAIYIILVGLPCWARLSEWTLLRVALPKVTCKSDSQVMVGQVNGEFEVKEPLLQRYYHAAKNSIARFSKAPLEHIPREDNKRADILSKLSVTKKKSHQRSVIQIWLRHPSVTEAEAECLAIDEAEAEADNWMTPVI